MDVTPKVSESLTIIEAYGDGGFRIQGERYEGALLIWPEETPVAWQKNVGEPYTVADFTSLLEHEASSEVELVVIGNGNEFAMLPPEVKQAFRARGIAVEMMDTGAACRTYNILLSEGRRVAAALLAV